MRLHPSSLDFALAHIEARGDTDIFPSLFEYQAIRQAWDASLRAALAGEDLSTWTVRPARRCLAPKTRLGLRIATQLDPLDTIVATGLVYELGEDLEGVRLPPR